MGHTPELEGLEEAVRRLADSLEWLERDSSRKQQTLREVFRLNVEIGKIARSFRWMAPALRELQLEVNLTTTLIKRNEHGAAKEGLVRVLAALAAVREVRSKASMESSVS